MKRIFVMSQLEEFDLLHDKCHWVRSTSFFEHTYLRAIVRFAYVC